MLASMTRTPCDTTARVRPLASLATRLALLGALLVPGAPAAGFTVEVTPFVGYRLGGVFTDEETDSDFEFDDTSSVGVVLAFEVDESSYVEVYYSHQDTDLIDDDGLFTGDVLFALDVDMFQVGGRYEWDPPSPVRPFMTGTLGLTHLDPKPSGLQSETRFSVSLGGGARIPVREWLSLRLEGRLFLTFLSSSTEIFCENGNCIGRVESSLLWQAELAAGLTFRF